ncbi:MAG: ABC transporter ATP-binding protein [Azoarcus sp.]|jgi:lipopolysaccharide transport system ATP-binding protein|nr:ABC transporter ATP-binding protein [Azoarcus sp.]
MSFDGHSIRVDSLGKRYEIYATPRERLKQFVLPALQRFVGVSPLSYFQEFWALRNVSFEIRKGEAFGIVGRNGSGKSTLLQLIAGTLSPTVGVVETRGRIAALLELGSGFNPDFTGRENVYFNAMLLGMTRDEVDERFDRIAAFADIGGHLEQPVKTYSSGMLLRLAFAVQVQIDPDILIVDEALAVGDALFQKRCFSRLEKLRADGVTLLFVSHDQESVRTLTQRAVLLKDGRMAEIGTSAQVLLAYRKLLHEEESAYFARLVPDTKAEAPAASNEAAQEAEVDKSSLDASRADKFSFGDGGVEIVSVKTFGRDGELCTVFYSGDLIRIRVECASRIETDHLNVGIRIRNREGVKIYSWGTLNQDMRTLTGNCEGEVFWKRCVHVGERFHVWLECDCTLGPNLYEVQASVSHEDRPDYTSQRMLHWMDEAAFFQALIRRDENYFNGLCDLRMIARWK